MIVSNSVTVHTMCCRFSAPLKISLACATAPHRIGCGCILVKEKLEFYLILLLLFGPITLTTQYKFYQYMTLAICNTYVVVSYHGSTL